MPAGSACTNDLAELVDSAIRSRFDLERLDNEIDSEKRDRTQLLRALPAPEGGG